MLEFWQNGKKIKIDAIYSKGKVGQLVIYGQRVDWGSNPNSRLKPLSQYPYLSIFTIVEKNSDSMDGYYILRDVNDNCIKVQFPYTFSGSEYLYDLQEWINWNTMHADAKLSRKQRKIEQLEGHVDLLKDILIKQGTRIVTEAQAEKFSL